jgi:hypothetical protein
MPNPFPLQNTPSQPSHLRTTHLWATSSSMSDGDPNQEPPNATLTPEEAKRIIHSHRKVRYGELEPQFEKCDLPFAILHWLKLCAGTACWPCRQRKVKCDNKQPCENCVKRDHARLCSYNPKNAKPATSSAGLVVGNKRPRSPETGSDGSSKRNEDRWPRTTGSSPHHVPSYQICGILRGLRR